MLKKEETNVLNELYQLMGITNDTGSHAIINTCCDTINTVHYTEELKIISKYMSIFQINKNKYPLKMLLCIFLRIQDKKNTTHTFYISTKIIPDIEKEIRNLLIQVKIHQEIDYDLYFNALKNDIKNYRTMDIKIDVHRNDDIYFKSSLDILFKIIEDLDLAEFSFNLDKYSKPIKIYTNILETLIDATSEHFITKYFSVLKNMSRSNDETIYDNKKYSDRSMTSIIKKAPSNTIIFRRCSFLNTTIIIDTLKINKKLIFENCEFVNSQIKHSRLSNVEFINCVGIDIEQCDISHLDIDNDMIKDDLRAARISYCKVILLTVDSCNNNNNKLEIQLSHCKIGVFSISNSKRTKITIPFTMLNKVNSFNNNSECELDLIYSHILELYKSPSDKLFTVHKLSHIPDSCKHPLSSDECYNAI